MHMHTGSDNHGVIYSFPLGSSRLNTGCMQNAVTMLPADKLTHLFFPQHMHDALYHMHMVKIKGIYTLHINMVSA